jgi:hypothetical protein
MFNKIHTTIFQLSRFLKSQYFDYFFVSFFFLFACFSSIQMLMHNNRLQLLEYFIYFLDFFPLMEFYHKSLCVIFSLNSAHFLSPFFAVIIDEWVAQGKPVPNFTMKSRMRTASQQSSQRMKRRDSPLPMSKRLASSRYFSRRALFFP